MTHRFTEQLFGGGGKHSLTAPKRPGTGRRSTPKRLLFLLIATGLIISLCGCGASGSKDAESNKQATDYEAQTAIKKQIEDTPLPKGYFSLVDDVDSWVTVLCQDGEATVSIRAFMDYTIPNVAELFLPIAQEATESAGVTLKRFEVNSYNTNKDGVVSETWASWQTEDGSTGTFTDNTDGGNIVKPGWTIEQVYEYYSDFDGIVKDMITEAGGSYE